MILGIWFLRTESFHARPTPLSSLPLAGCIQVSQATRDLLPGHTFTPTGGVQVKGKVGVLSMLPAHAHHVCPRLPKSAQICPKSAGPGALWGMANPGGERAADLVTVPLFYCRLIHSVHSVQA